MKIIENNKIKKLHEIILYLNSYSLTIRKYLKTIMQANILLFLFTFWMFSAKEMLIFIIISILFMLLIVFDNLMNLKPIISKISELRLLNILKLNRELFKNYKMIKDTKDKKNRNIYFEKKSSCKDNNLPLFIGFNNNIFDFVLFGEKKERRGKVEYDMTYKCKSLNELNILASNITQDEKAFDDLLTLKELSHLILFSFLYLIRKNIKNKNNFFKINNLRNEINISDNAHYYQTSSFYNGEHNKKLSKSNNKSRYKYEKSELISVFNKYTAESILRVIGIATLIFTLLFISDLLGFSALLPLIMIFVAKKIRTEYLEKQISLEIQKHIDKLKLKSKDITFEIKNVYKIIFNVGESYDYEWTKGNSKIPKPIVCFGKLGADIIDNATFIIIKNKNVQIHININKYFNKETDTLKEKLLELIKTNEKLEQINENNSYVDLVDVFISGSKIDKNNILEAKVKQRISLIDLLCNETKSKKFQLKYLM